MKAILWTTAVAALAGAAHGQVSWSYLNGGDAAFLGLTNGGALERAVTEGRIGNRAMNGQWETAIWQQGAVGTPQTQGQYVFGNNVAVNWSVQFDGASTVTYTLGSSVLTWNAASGGFTDIFVRIRSEADSSITLSNLDLVGSGLTLGNLASSGGGVDYLRISNTSDFGAFTLSGTTLMTWGATPPSGSQLAYQVKLSRVIPAPGAAGLLAVLGVAAARRKR